MVSNHDYLTGYSVMIHLMSPVIECVILPLYFKLLLCLPYLFNIIFTTTAGTKFCKEVITDYKKNEIL